MKNALYILYMIGLIFHNSSTSVIDFNYIALIAVKKKYGFLSLFFAQSKINKSAVCFLFHYSTSKALPFALFSLFNVQG